MVVNRIFSMDQIVKALGLINSFQIDGLHGAANPTAGAKLNLAGGLDSLRLTALDGEADGITITSQGFGVGNVSLPTPQDPSIALDPYLSHLMVDVHKQLFERLAEFAREPLLAHFHGVIDRVMLRRLHTKIRITKGKVIHADIDLDQVFLQNVDVELIRIRDVSLSVLDFDTNLPPKQAQKECTVVLRSLRVEIEQAFFERVLGAVRTKIPSFIKNLVVELPGPPMIVGGYLKKGPIGTSFRADLSLKAENEMFGIHFDRFYVPGTNLSLPNMFRNLFLTTIRSIAEKKGQGLVEVSNQSVRINPWPKIPVELQTHVSKFAVEEGKIVIVFSEPPNREAPPRADEYVLQLARIPLPGEKQRILAPGPAL